MQESIRRYAQRTSVAGRPEIAIRIGLNSGEVVVRSIEGGLHSDYTAVGEVTHLANRIEQLATPGTILMTENTRRLSAHHVQVDAHATVHVKGLAAPVIVYELTGIAAASWNIAVRPLTPLVGRHQELAELHALAREARTGRGRIAALVGDPGMGKTRLTFELAEALSADRWLVLRGSGVAYGRSIPYMPLVELLKGYFDITPADSPTQMRNKVARKGASADSLGADVRPILTLLALPGDEEWWELDPLQRRQRAMKAIVDLLVGESRRQPLCVVVENLHWIDTETQACLNALAEAIPTERILLLTNYRPEYRNPWVAGDFCRQFPLTGLSADESHILFEELAGRHPSLNPLARTMVERADGNPFFLQELRQMLIETEVVVGDAGLYRAKAYVSGGEVPATVQAVLAARIDRLGPEERAVLQAAAVIGRRVPLPLLAQVIDGTDIEVRSTLASLEAKEFIDQTIALSPQEYTFRHALTQEVANRSLVRARRQGLHARLVNAIEQLYPERLAEHINELAHHAYEGQLWAKALRYCREAATKAWASSAHAAAVEYFERSLTALDHLPDQSATAVDAVDLRFELRNSLYPLGRLGQIDTVLRDAEQAALRLDEPERLARVRSYQAHYLWISGRYTEAADAARRALELATRIDHFGLKVASESYLGYAFHALGDYRHGIEVLNRVISRLDGELARDRLGTHGVPSVLCRTWLAFCHLELGEFQEGLRRSAEGIAIAETTSHPYTLNIALQGEGLLLLRKGEASRAIAPLEHALALCQEWDLRLTYPGIAPHLGLAYAMLGDIERGLPLVETAIERAVEMGFQFDLAHRVTELGRVYLLAGRLPDAEHCATRALRLARDRQEHGNEGWAFWLRAEIAAATGDIARAKEAEDHFSTALAIAGERMMRPLVARCHLGLGHLYRQRGQVALSSANLAAANTLFLDLDMVP